MWLMILWFCWTGKTKIEILCAKFNWKVQSDQVTVSRHYATNKDSLYYDPEGFARFSEFYKFWIWVSKIRIHEIRNMNNYGWFTCVATIPGGGLLVFFSINNYSCKSGDAWERICLILKIYCPNHFTQTVNVGSFCK